MQRTVPIFHIHTYDAAKSFYVDWLGFNIDWEFRFEPSLPVYMQISRDGLLLHLSEHKGGNPGSAMCHAEVDDLDALVSEWKEKRPDFDQVPQRTPWNAKHLVLRDPFGNEMGLNEMLPDDAGA